MAIRTIQRPRLLPASETAVPCPCGVGDMQPGLRYERDAIVPVSICWECSREIPPLYKSSRQRSTRRPCAWCSKRFWSIDQHRQTCSIPCEQRRTNVAAERAREGQRSRRRVS